MQITDNLDYRNVPSHGTNRLALVAAMVVLSDVLIFAQTPGLNLFLLAILVTAAILISTARRRHFSMAAWCLGISVSASAPLLEAPSPMGVAVSLTTILCVALVNARLVPQRLTRLPLVLCRFVLVVPIRLAQDYRKYLNSHTERSILTATRRSLGTWVVPLILASIFLLLFATANPLIEQVLRDVDFTFLLRFMDLWRIGFWVSVAVFVWAMLRPRLKRMRLRATADRSAPADAENTLLNHASLLRSLVLFNALFAVESLLDLIYLWGGAALPNGMSHADYAHRGAYPLIATALLAAGFVFLAMRQDGPGNKSPLIRGLVHAWIGQNILLCLSSILRLDLYVEAYSLTELRVAAGIWMGIVAVGLVLISLRILLNRSNEWLIAMNIAILAGVLYLSAFIDFPAFIAQSIDTAVFCSAVPKTLERSSLKP